MAVSPRISSLFHSQLTPPLPGGPNSKVTPSSVSGFSSIGDAAPNGTAPAALNGTAAPAVPGAAPNGTAPTG
ncbi:hypothetical protein WME97_33530 [Sorangium sp. So ce367]|uniref:hypothetical protein n=1 Tax=Sorangium sp. So ce367 TaxID=3133305 RepID=UPI003F61D16E